MKNDRKKNNKSKNELKPLCLDFESNIPRDVCLNAEGYFTPCCWFDAADAKLEDPRIAGFFDPALNIKNHNDPKDIIEGPYWQKFLKRLVKEPENAPKRCWRHCGSELITDKNLGNNKRISF